MCLSEESDYTGALTPIEEVSVARFTLCGSPHSLPTYKVVLMLHLSQQPFLPLRQLPEGHAQGP